MEVVVEGVPVGVDPVELIVGAPLSFQHRESTYHLGTAIGDLLVSFSLPTHGDFSRSFHMLVGIICLPY